MSEIKDQCGDDTCPDEHGDEPIIPSLEGVRPCAWVRDEIQHWMDQRRD